MNKALLLLAVGLSVAIFIYTRPQKDLGLSVPIKESSGEQQDKIGEGSTKHFSPNNTPTVSLDTLTPTAYQVPPAPIIQQNLKKLPPELSSWFKKQNILPTFEKLAPYFPLDNLGHQLLVATILSQVQESANKDEIIRKIQSQNMHDLEMMPQESLEAAALALRNMGQLHLEEKQFLLTFIQELDLPLEEKREVLVAECRRSVDPGESKDHAASGPLRAYQILAKLYQDERKERQFFLITRDILEAQKESPAIQKELWESYKKIDGRKAKELAKEFHFNPK